AEVRDARRVEMIAVAAQPTPEAGAASVETGRRLPRLNDNQLSAMAELEGAGGRVRVRDLRERLERAGIPESTLATLVKRGLVRLEEAAEAFHYGGVGDSGKNAH